MLQRNLHIVNDPMSQVAHRICEACSATRYLGRRTSKETADKNRLDIFGDCHGDVENAKTE